MVWKVFDYDQSNTINGSQALAPYGEGACLALSMKWCALRKRRTSSLKYNDAVSTELQKQEIATWMNNVQDSVLQDLALNNGYKYSDLQGDPISTVDNTKGKINNMRAYANRLEKMSQWAGTQGMSLLDDKVGFSNGVLAPAWTSQLTDAAFRLSAPPVLGVIGLTGADDGHAFAYEYTRDGYDRISFFDPNFGEYRGTSLVEFTHWLLQHVIGNYSDLDQHWWVVQFR
jgi:hypothetical protein